VVCPLDVPIRELRSLVRWLDGSLSRVAVLWGRPGPVAARREFVLQHRRTRVVLSGQPRVDKIAEALASLVDPTVERSHRFPSEIPGKILDDGGSVYDATLENFSRTGVLLRTDAPLKLGVPIQLEFARAGRRFGESVIPMRFADERGVGAEFESPSDNWLVMFDQLSQGSRLPPLPPDRSKRVSIVPSRMRLSARLQSGRRRHYFRVRDISAQRFRASIRGPIPPLESPMEALVFWTDGSFSGTVTLADSEPDIEGALEFAWAERPLGLRELLLELGWRRAPSTD
jgi:hypothetical protein